MGCGCANGLGCGSFFMSIGSIIRTEGRSPMAMEAWARAGRMPVVGTKEGRREPNDGT
jgi:hypothetical protein